MNDLTYELRLWLEAEKASPDWVEGDPKLLLLVMRQLGGMRSVIAEAKIGEDTSDIEHEYHEMYKAFDELMGYRVIKNAKLIGI
jgi:hypothetical protein